jgi:hypothetical protein
MIKDCGIPAIWIMSISLDRHPFDPANHEAVSAANVVYGIVKDGRVVRLRSERSAAAQ